jgi:formylglycine-generating enzyme required for sulfatase activity
VSQHRRPVRVFFSYSHADDAHRLRLEKALKLLERQGLIDTWSDRKLLPGDRWEEGIERELERADLILFLVSDDFVASDFIWGREMTRAMERHEAGEARVVPVIVRPCDWESAPFGKLQAIPKDGQAVTDPEWGSEDTAWTDVAKRLRSLVEELGRPGVGEASEESSGEGARSGPGLTRYLEALEARNSYVEIRGMGAQVAEQLPLDRVYTRLRVAGVRGVGEDLRERKPLEPGAGRLEIRGMVPQIAEPLSRDRAEDRAVDSRPGEPGAGDEEREERSREEPVDEAGAFRRSLSASHRELPAVLRRSRSAVLIGDPGSGKTTFLRFAAQVLARSLLAGDPSVATRELGVEAESTSDVPLPILVRLSRFAEFLRDRPDDSCPNDAPKHLLRYLEFDLKGRNLGLQDDALRRRVVEGGCFLLLDGLDEVPGPLRPRVAAIVDELVATAPSEPANRYLITCRTRAYTGLARLGGLPAYTLAPLEDDQVAAFVRGWSRALFQVRRPAEGDGTGRAAPGEAASDEAGRYEAELLQAILSHDDVGPMTESPLMLTMLAVVHWSRKKLPERRNELYEESVEYLLESRKDHSAFPAPQRREALQALALALFTDTEGVQRSLGLPEAARAVAPVLQVGDAEARAFLDQEALQSGLLVSRTEGEVEFWHLSFQEYLAALELATSGEYWEVLSKAGRLHDDRWSEVVLLLAGCLRRLGGQRAARRLIERILATGVDRVSQARAVGLIGRILADVEPYGGDPAVGTGYPQALRETLAIFEPPGEDEEVVEETVRVEVGEALGQAGDPRLANPEENRVEIPGGTFWMGAQNEDPRAPGYDPEARLDESPVRRVTVGTFLAGRYPVTVEEFRRFVEAADEGYLNAGNWEPEGWAWRERSGLTRPRWWENQLRHPNRPVTAVSWYEADAYCRWAGGRLPTEAEWELMGRGEAGRRYPWGEAAPDEAHGNFGMSVGHPTPVGIYPLGATPEGICDLAGNVWEWCGDWAAPYPETEEENPTGPASGAIRILRGGAYFYNPKSARCAFRGTTFVPEDRIDDIGFRVVREPGEGA